MSTHFFGSVLCRIYIVYPVYYTIYISLNEV